MILPWLVAVWLVLVSLWGIVSSRNLVHLVACLAVAQSSSYVLLLAAGYRTGLGAPIFTSGHKPPAVDPVVQALALTDIVVGATVTALLLAVAIQVFKRRGTLDPRRLRTLHDGGGAGAARPAAGART